MLGPGFGPAPSWAWIIYGCNQKSNWLTNICQAIYNSEDPSPVPVSPPQSHLPSNNCFHPPSPASRSHLIPATNAQLWKNIAKLWRLFCHSLTHTFIEPGVKVAGVGSLSARAKSPIKIFVRRYFCDKCVVFTRNFKFSNLIQYNMQYKICNNVLLAQETLLLPQKSTIFLPKSAYIATNLNIATK